MYNNKYNFVNNELCQTLKFIKKNYFFCFLILYVSQIFYGFSTYFTGTIVWAPKLYLLFKICKLSAFFNSAGKSFQRIAPIVLAVSKPHLLVLIFRLFTVTPGFRL